MRENKLNPEELELLSDFEAGEFKSVMTSALKKCSECG
jgi:hypothetical protein